MKLYYAPRTRSSRPRWLLEELEVPYDLIRIDLSKKEHKNPDYLKIHPHGSVPAFEDGSLKMIESAAICLYLADQFPEKKLAPKIETPERGLYYQWIMYGMATVDPLLFSVFENEGLLPEEKRSQATAQIQRKRFVLIAENLNKKLSETDYILGDQFSAADIIIGSTMIWANSMKMIENYSSIQNYVNKMKVRPAYLRATKD